MAATDSGVSPNERVLITGFAGLLFTSSTGEKSMVMPIARPSSAVARPCSRAKVVSPVAGFFNTITHYGDLKAENTKLRRQLDEARADAIRGAEISRLEAAA